MRIAVILPSRGLIFSETAAELLDNLEGYDYDIFFVHDLPIPDCFEKPLQQALKGPYSHIWFVEEDMLLPKGTLDKMVKADCPVVTMDYPVSKEGQGTVFEVDSRVIFCGTGCLLIKKEVFDIVRPPYFRTDVRWTAQNHGKFVRLTAGESSNLEGYGLHDVTFGIKLYKFGIPITVVGKVGQRKLISLGKAGSNDGAHNIEVWTKVKPNFLYKKLSSNPVAPIGKLITVRIGDKDMTVHPSHAKKLIKNGQAKPLPQLKLGIDYNGINI